MQLVALKHGRDWVNHLNMQIGDIIVTEPQAYVESWVICLGWVVESVTPYRVLIRGWDTKYKLMERVYSCSSLRKLC